MFCAAHGSPVAFEPARARRPLAAGPAVDRPSFARSGGRDGRSPTSAARWSIITCPEIWFEFDRRSVIHGRSIAFRPRDEPDPRTARRPRSRARVHVPLRPGAVRSALQRGLDRIPRIRVGSDHRTGGPSRDGGDRGGRRARAGLAEPRAWSLRRRTPLRSSRGDVARHGRSRMARARRTATAPAGGSAPPGRARIGTWRSPSPAPPTGVRSSGRSSTSAAGDIFQANITQRFSRRSRLDPPPRPPRPGPRSGTGTTGPTSRGRTDGRSFR